MGPATAGSIGPMDDAALTPRFLRQLSELSLVEAKRVVDGL